MCGIAAIAGIKFDISRYKTDAMLQKLERRGPDGKGEKLFSDCWLGHRRLAIVDLEDGSQPMSDGELAVTFNGEIYNYKELRFQLEVEGIKFWTKSDTEVILKAYRKWGKECPKYLDGMFAFAIWDDKEKEIFLARDRFGKKPLYYFFDGSAILIASEIKSLIASGVLSPQIDYSSIDDYLRLMYVPSNKSIYKNIHQIPPAHCGTFKNGKILTERYWGIIHNPIDISYYDAKAEIHRILSRAVKKRLINSDVEVGAFLSGGLDSSLVALLAAKELNHSLKVFSVSYNHINEISFARQVSDEIGSEISIVNVDEASIGELGEVISYFDEPHADTSDFPQHLVSKLAAKKVKVVLSGDGSDELFLGYNWHLNKNFNNYSDLSYERLNSICAFSKSLRKDLWISRDVVDNTHGFLDKEIYEDSFSPIELVTAFDLTSHLPGQILTKVDRAGMMHGLEVRSPFLDTELVQFVFNLPYEFKVNGITQKYILRDILSEYMPKDFAFRRKQGFGAPIKQWLNDSNIKTFIYSKLGPKARIRSIFLGKEIDRYLSDYYKNKDSDIRSPQRLWVLLCLEIWLDRLNLI